MTVNTIAACLRTNWRRPAYSKVATTAGKTVKMIGADTLPSGRNAGSYCTDDLRQVEEHGVGQIGGANRKQAGAHYVRVELARRLHCPGSARLVARSTVVAHHRRDAVSDYPRD